MPNSTNARHEEALALRNTGMSYSAIARQLGYGNYPSAARYAVMSAIRNQTTTVVSELRQFGVEAEFYGITPATAVNALRAVGINVEFEGYTHSVTSHWKIVTDGSVTPRGTGQGSGLELVSPILKGQEGLIELEKALNALDAAGGKVNTTCGLHVHIDTAGLKDFQRKNFFNSYVRNQDVLDRLVSPTRRNNTHFTQRYTDNQMAVYANHAESGRGGSSRYYTVNTLSLPRYGTLEFRQHQGTLNGKKVVAWVQLLLAIAKNAAESTQDGYNIVHTVEAFLDMMEVDSVTKAYLLRREAQLNRTSVAA